MILYQFLFLTPVLVAGGRFTVRLRLLVRYEQCRQTIFQAYHPAQIVISVINM